MTSRRQPIGLILKSQSQISTEQVRLMGLMANATRGNGSSSMLLSSWMDQQTVPISNNPDELKAIINQMTIDELRFNLNFMADRMGKIATRDEFILLLKEIDQTNYRNVKNLSDDDYERMSYDELMKYAREHKIQWISDKGWTHEDIEEILDQNDKDRESLPDGQMTMFDAMIEMSYYGIPDDDIHKIALALGQDDTIPTELINKSKEHGLTDKQMDRYIELIKKSRANTPQGQLSSYDINHKLERAGLTRQEIDQIVKSIEYRILNPDDGNRSDATDESVQVKDDGRQTDGTESPDNGTETPPQDTTGEQAVNDTPQGDNRDSIVFF